MADFTELNTSAELAAKRLLGCHLIRKIGSNRLVVKIVETEAYSQDDPASHSFRGITKRTEVMFESAGRAYIYFTYGMHYCLNVVVGPKGRGEAVLIRAVEPITGIKLIRANRPKAATDLMLTNGPGKLCQALMIDSQLNSHDLSRPPLELRLMKPLTPMQLVADKRIGISRSTERLWRFYIKANPYVSKVNKHY